MFYSIPVQEYPGLIKVRCQFPHMKRSMICEERSKGSEVAVITSHALSVRNCACPSIFGLFVCAILPIEMRASEGSKTVENVSHATGNPSLTSMKSRWL